MILVAHVPRFKRRQRVFIVTTVGAAKKTTERLKRARIDSEQYPMARVNVICDIKDKDDLELFILFAQYHFGLAYNQVNGKTQVETLKWDKMSNNFDLIKGLDTELGWMVLNKKYPWVQDAFDAMSAAGRLLAKRK